MSLLQQQIKKSWEEFKKEFGHIYAVKNEMSGNSYKTFSSFLRQQLIDYHKAILSALPYPHDSELLNENYQDGYNDCLAKVKSILGEGEV